MFVPHTELARQFEYWLELLQTSKVTQRTQEASSFGSASFPNTSTRYDRNERATPPDSLVTAQVIYRGHTEPELKPSTDFLISTPNALLDLLPAIDLFRLHTVALDEADSMLSLPNRFASQLEIVRWRRHPPLLQSIMEQILAPKRFPPRSKNSEVTIHRPGPGVRLVAISATANSVFRDWLVRRSGWIGSRGILGERQVDWYDFSSDAQGMQPTPGETEYQRIGRGMLPQDNIEHTLYAVERTGGVVEVGRQLKEEMKAIPEDPERFLLAVATLFALERVTSGLVLIPSGQSLTKTLDTFRSLGVPAATLSEASDLAPDEPRLYVVSIDAVRGLDIADLSHVFLLPALADESSLYLHVAGRVGRLSIGGKRRSGKVICLVSQENERQAERVKRCWELLGIRGTHGHDIHETDKP